jgi:hypothetical protein
MTGFFDRAGGHLVDVSTTQFTVAEFIGQMDREESLVNRDYQRSNRVWPPAARSYLIDTILLGFPMPKMTLFQKTDLATRKTVKEIVDGQQRSQAISDFFHDRIRLNVRSPWAGKTLSQLDDVDQQRFLDYQLSFDVLVGATEDQIRQLFRRINSYTVPLNPQEIRHATHQGEFKWFIVRLEEEYAQVFKDMGVFTESQLARMADGELLTSLIAALLRGIETSSPSKLEAIYERFDQEFKEAAPINKRIQRTMDQFLEWRAIHRTRLVKPYNFYSLFLAVSHKLEPVESLQSLHPVRQPGSPPSAGLDALIALAEALDNPEDHPEYADFVAAASQATNTLKQRTERFKWFAEALDSRE